MCVPAYRFVQESAQGGQKGALDSLELGLQAVWSHLVGARTVYTLNH